MANSQSTTHARTGTRNDLMLTPRDRAGRPLKRMPVVRDCSWHLVHHRPTAMVDRFGVLNAGQEHSRSSVFAAYDEE